MSSASQGPGWWQASDGNWYPPQEQSAPPPPPPPAPAAPPGNRRGRLLRPHPQHPGDTRLLPARTSNAQAAFSASSEKSRSPGWLVVGGLFVALVAFFLPLATANVNIEGIVSSSQEADMKGVQRFSVCFSSSGDGCCSRQI